MGGTMHILLTIIGLLCNITPTQSFVSATIRLFGCQGKDIPVSYCSHAEGIYDVESVTVYTSHDVDDIQNHTTTNQQCIQAGKCERTIHSAQDKGLSDDYIYLFNWILNRCNGKRACDAESKMPSWWSLTDDHTGDECPDTGTQHFVGALIVIKCKNGEIIPTVPAPQETTPKTRPTTPTTTTAFPVFIPVYVPELIGREKVILGVAIGLAIAILIVLLIILYCCETYRTSKKFSKLLRMLGAPQAQNDAFDDFEDYGKSDAWKEETNANYDALGEYTGVKPDEFLTLDKRAMETSGQIMYDSNTQTMTMGRGNSCTTLSRNGRINSHPSGPMASQGYIGPMDYNTDENLDLEARMAATLNEKPDYEEDVSYH